jgi:hypothetical protein
MVFASIVEVVGGVEQLNPVSFYLLYPTGLIEMKDRQERLRVISPRIGPVVIPEPRLG